MNITLGTPFTDCKDKDCDVYEDMECPQILIEIIS